MLFPNKKNHLGEVGNDQQRIWRSTSNPVFSEKSINKYFLETAKEVEIYADSYAEISRSILEAMKQHILKGNKNESFTLSDSLDKEILKRVLRLAYIKARGEFVNKMIEANISVLNGKSISEGRKITEEEPIMQSVHWVDFHPNDNPAVIKGISEDLVEEFFTDLQDFHSTFVVDFQTKFQGDWSSYEKENWRHISSPSEKKEWTDEGWRDK